MSPEPGYDFSVMVDLENLPADPEAREQLVQQFSLLRRNVMAAPFERAFNEFSKLEEESARYSLEALPQHIKDGGEVMTIHYREEEAIFIKANYDGVTVIFSTIFRDETDRIFGKVFLQVGSQQWSLMGHFQIDTYYRSSSTFDEEQFRTRHRYSSATIHPLSFKVFRV